MSDDHNDVTRQAQQHAGLERDEQQLPRPAEVKRVRLCTVRLILLGQWLSSRTILLWWLLRSIIIITCGHYTPDREGDYEQDEEDDRIGDLQVGEQALCPRVGGPRQ